MRINIEDKIPKIIILLSQWDIENFFFNNPDLDTLQMCLH